MLKMQINKKRPQRCAIVGDRLAIMQTGWFKEVHAQGYRCSHSVRALLASRRALPGQDQSAISRTMFAAF